MAILIIFNLLIFTKLLLFWLWLWQLKEYHLGRFFAHFEAQAFRKIISSFWRIKYPKFTKKIIVILLASLSLAFILAIKGYYLYIYFLIIFVPLVFQIPTVLWRKRYLNKAKKKRESFKNLLVIGITGSYGKTSTKEFLYTILAEKFGKEKILKTKEHQNSEVGISQCILSDLTAEHEIFICEMGAYGRGGIKLLCDIVKPKIGILTGINEQHMATFGSLKNIIKTKYELIESLPKDGIAFFNTKNKYCLELYQKTPQRSLGLSFLYGAEARVFGEENLLGAMAAAKKLGMTEEEISRAVSKIKNKLPGIQSRKGINGITIFDATYSANPDSVIGHLEYLEALPGRKIIIMPCLIELGKASVEIHRKIGKKIAEVCDLAIITTKDRFQEIKEGAGEKAILLENPKEIFEKIKSFCKSGDIILLESRVPAQLIKQLFL
ncbi:MAG: Mur ligase family protein [bacterium]|nr:Mur ligase family protein [bacterium]